MTVSVAGPETAGPDGTGGFSLRLDNFEGPFDLLLQLISRHKLDITEVALSRVTDEFIAHIKAAGDAWDLEQTSHFVVVAATLLDLKAARLLPTGEVDDADDLALLEARDVLFARLLQYKAFKEIAGWMSAVLDGQALRGARPGGLEPHYAELLPEVVIHVTAERFAALAAKALTPAAPAAVSLTHLHAPAVTVREQAEVVVDRLRQARALSFRALVGDAPDRITTVCRFLALLELFREQAVAFEQAAPLGELTIRWTGGDRDDLVISDEFDVTPDPEADHEPGAEPDDRPEDEGPDHPTAEEAPA